MSRDWSLFLKTVLLVWVGYAARPWLEPQPDQPDFSYRQSYSALPAGAQIADNDRGVPPRRFRGDRTVVVQFVSDPDELKRLCEKSDAAACAAPDRIIAPNPCAPDPAVGSLHLVPSTGKITAGEWYDTMLCHELGHMNGWADHWFIPSELDAEQDEIVLNQICRRETDRRVRALETYDKPVADSLSRLVAAGKLVTKGGYHEAVNCGGAVANHGEGS